MRSQLRAAILLNLQRTDVQRVNNSRRQQQQREARGVSEGMCADAFLRNVENARACGVCVCHCCVEHCRPARRVQQSVAKHRKRLLRLRQLLLSHRRHCSAQLQGRMLWPQLVTECESMSSHLTAPRAKGLSSPPVRCKARAHVHTVSRSVHGNNRMNGAAAISIATTSTMTNGQQKSSSYDCLPSPGCL